MRALRPRAIRLLALTLATGCSHVGEAIGSVIGARALEAAAAAAGAVVEDAIDSTSRDKQRPIRFARMYPRSDATCAAGPPRELVAWRDEN